MLRDGGPKRALFAREVIQSSPMDCGPATLWSLLRGMGLVQGSWGEDQYEVSDGLSELEA